MLSDKRRALLQWLGAAALSVSLAGCFQPLYMSANGAGSPAGDITTVEVAPIAGRTGHFLRTSLQFELGGGIIPQAPVYRVTILPVISNRIAAVDRGTAVADNVTAVIDASYSLTEISSGTVFKEGGVTGLASFGRSTQRFANIQAQQNAEERAAKLVAEQIRTHITIALANRGR
jgi:LPS-assembly lipoprotein